jgi:predicted amidohydrolase
MELKITIAQMDVATSQPSKNLQKAEAWIAEASHRGSDVICFPEMWTTGFNWEKNKRIAKEHEKVINRIATMAKKYNIWINGSMLALNQARKISNTSILFNPKGERAGTYCKTHLFSLFHEEDHIVAGRSLTIVDTPWGRTGLSICYDIRFPELFRTYALNGAQVIFCPIAFPYPRLEHWKVLVRARAIENQMFMIGVNQVGKEDLGNDGVVTYFGNSVIIDPWGKTIVEANETNEMLLTAKINMDQVVIVRNKMKVFCDRRPELYELD